MELKILSITGYPMETISLAAGRCYGKDDVSENRVKTCFNNGHTSVFEHATVTFQVSGISRSCSHQLVRHRVASFSQKSQRYTKLTLKDLKEGDWYVTPPYILEDRKRKWDYDKDMESVLTNYLGLLDMGVKPEDARFLLPEGTKTDIVCSMNLREIYHFLDVRLSKNSQWEIRDLAKGLYEELCYKRYDGDAENKETWVQWRKLMLLWYDENREKADNLGVGTGFTHFGD